MRLWKNKTKNRKTLLAIAFAGGILTSPPPAFSEDTPVCAETVEQALIKNTRVTPEYRAFHLLKIGKEHLCGAKQSEIESNNLSTANESNPFWTYRGWHKHSLPFDQFSSETADTSNVPKNSTEQAKTKPENIQLADKAIGLAITELDKATDKFAKLNMYVTALHLFERTENTVGSEQCLKVLEAEFKACEGETAVDEDQILTATTVLNRMASNLITVFITDFDPRDLPNDRHDRKFRDQLSVKPFTETDFKRSEELRLRAIAIADRLGEENHLRRKAHRDMVLWYTRLGKVELAEKEKRILFELVGFEDESILYPQAGMCGHLIWWTRKITSSGGFCGMG